MKFQLLYFDDQIANIECYQAMLKDQFNVTGFTDSTIYKKALASNKPHGIILDLHMPVYDGLVLHDKIINSEDYNGCPIFFISGDPSDEIRLKSIQKGGVDFFNRHLSEEEVRLRLINKIKFFFQGDTIVEVGNLRLDAHLFNVYISDVPIDLTLIEMRILSCLIRRIPEQVNKTDLMEQIWGDGSKKGKMNVHLSHLKLKLSGWDHEIKNRENFISIVAN